MNQSLLLLQIPAKVDLKFEKKFWIIVVRKKWNFFCCCEEIILYYYNDKICLITLKELVQEVFELGRVITQSDLSLGEIRPHLRQPGTIHYQNGAEYVGQKLQRENTLVGVVGVETGQNRARHRYELLFERVQTSHLPRHQIQTAQDGCVA